MSLVTAIYRWKPAIAVQMFAQINRWFKHWGKISVVGYFSVVPTHVFISSIPIRRVMLIWQTQQKHFPICCKGNNAAAAADVGTTEIQKLKDRKVQELPFETFSDKNWCYHSGDMLNKMNSCTKEGGQGDQLASCFIVSTVELCDVSDTIWIMNFWQNPGASNARSLKAEIGWWSFDDTTSCEGNPNCLISRAVLRFHVITSINTRLIMLLSKDE